MLGEGMRREVCFVREPAQPDGYFETDPGSERGKRGAGADFGE
jgi:hypothetical protein